MNIEIFKRRAIKMKSKGFHIEDIARKLCKSSRTIQRYTKDSPHPNRSFLRKIPKYGRKLSPEKAEIIGYLAAEGCDYDKIVRYKEFDKRRGKIYKRIKKFSLIEFSNMNKVIRERFQKLINKVFEYKQRFYDNGTLRLSRIRVVEDLRSYTRFGSRKWKVPKEILYSKKEIYKILFCRAFFDGDGTVDVKRRRIIFDSINHVGLKEIGKLLLDLEIKSKMYKFRDRSRILIKDNNLFISKIGVLHPDKLKRLKLLKK